MKKWFLPIVLIVLGIGSYSYFNVDLAQLRDITESTVTSYVKEEGDVQLYFCPQEDCEGALVNFIDSATESIHCALFEVGLPSVQEKLREKSEVMDVKIVEDNNYAHKFNESFVQFDKWGLQHNKFCIIDGVKITTGSMNPTKNGAHKNNNNLLFINSEMLAANYEAEFQEMWNGVFKKGDPVLNPSVQVSDIKIKNYFCPDDDCADKVKDELKKAEKSIHFMTFSFTNEGIANVLLLKHTDGVLVEGVMEARQVTKHSQFMRLEYQGVDVVKDGNKNNLHHKVFIIDEKVVITGSMNPTGGGDKRNDENVLIIEDVAIAGKFMEEFEKVWSEATDD